MKHPRTRVLDRIWRMREELEVILDVNMQQQELLQNYLRILEPCTFRATTFIRAARFRVEAPYLSAQLRRAHAARLRISDLDSRLEDVSTHVSRMLEVQQENNGNAIIVFTIVTIIFLPLSWVTSYLGMNTSDVRDLAQGQWLYWTISLPVTMLVIGIAVLVVLKGESVREFFIKRQMMGDRRGVTAGSMSVKTGFSTRMTDASLARKQSTMRPNDLLGRSGLWRRSARAGRAGEV
jgi:Mg2+ and Co2+ transporter CorA